MRRAFWLYLGILIPTGYLTAGELEVSAPIKLEGSISNPLEISGATLHGSLLVICPDEGSSFDVLEASGSDRFHALRSNGLSDDPDVELDLEGAGSDGRFLYLIGSHSLARKKLSPDNDYKKNQKRLLEIKDEKERCKLFRLTLSDQGKLKKTESISLRKLLRNDELLSPFTKIPSKENGIDIEGVAVRDDRLYLGFRGPVLRCNFVPVMVLKFDSPEDYELRYLDLGGRGIRDIAAVKDGFLLIAGPMGDGAGTDELCYWNGKDGLPGQDAPHGKVRVLGDIPSKRGTKAEGLAVLSEDDAKCTLLIVYDGADRGGPQKIVVQKSWR